MNSNKERKKRIFEYMQSKAYVPLKLEELACVLEVPKDEINLLEIILMELISEKKIRYTKKRRYVVNDRHKTYTGSIQGSKRGFTFFVSEDKTIEDVYIPFENLNGAIHKDKVEIRITKKASNNRKSEGEVLAILDRINNEIIGIVERQKQFLSVRPLDKKTNIIDIENPPKHLKAGDIVICKVIASKKNGMYLTGKIIEIIGSDKNINSYFKAILKENEYTLTYPEKAVEEAIKINKEAFKEIDHTKRKDMRKELTITIDGEDAKDLDDAISIRRLDNGNFYVGVHIADVSHYVRKNSELDKEALLRGNSVYLVDTVIPMLPEQLSNDLCSLNPHVDRLAFSVMMEVNAQGDVKDFEIAETIINVDERMTYKNVQKILDNDEQAVKKYQHIVDMISMMNELCDILIAKKRNKGALDFEFKESKVILDQKKNPLEIKQYELEKSNKIIEQLMILCNETVAQNFAWQEWPFIYRIHEKPEESKMDSLSDFAKGLGLHVKRNKNIHPLALQELIASVKGSKLEHLINTVTLRSLKKAKYSPYNEGHFGLASDFYCHFTSPIRRYPDLMIHRLIKDNLQGKNIANEYSDLMIELEEIADNCSDTERKAELAERDLIDLYKAVYMKKHIGDTFVGVISGVMQYGLFVELENTVEGFIRIDSLQGYYTFDKEGYRLYKEGSQFSYTLGELVEVKIIDVTIHQREIDMIITKKIKQ